MQPIAASSIASSSGGIVPALRYRDVRAAVTWLCNAFGFEQHRLLEDEDGSVRYAQLAFGNSMIMLCPVGGSAFDAYMAQPGDTGGFETQVCYVHVADAQAHQERAAAAGAEIVLDIDGGEGKGRGYSCRDLEGHIWSFGTYDPWRLADAPQMAADAARPVPTRMRRLAAVAGIVVIAVLASAGLVNWVHGAADPSLAATLASIDDVLEKPADLESAERLLRQARAELARERATRMQAERRSNELKEASTREREERIGAERALREARAQPGYTPPASSFTGGVQKAEPVQFPAGAPASAEVCAPGASAAHVRFAAQGALGGSEEIKALRRAMEQAEAQLQQERQARETTVQGTKEVHEQLARERIARELAERHARDAVRKAMRIEAARRAEFMRRNGGDDYRDVVRLVFPES